MSIKFSKGFTLIELVVTIVILGILSASAVPKVMGLQHDARVSAVEGLSGAIKSAAESVFSKAIIAGKDKKTGENIFVCEVGPSNGSECDTDGSLIYIYKGYPTAKYEGLISALSGTFSSNADDDVDWVYEETSYGSNAALYIYAKGSSLTADSTSNKAKGCGLIYIQPTAEEQNYLIKIVDSDC